MIAFFRSSGDRHMSRASLLLSRTPFPRRLSGGTATILLALFLSSCTPIEMPLPADAGTATATSSADPAGLESPLLPDFAPALELGEEVPNLDLETQDGQPLALDDLSGLVVVLSFFSCRHPEDSPDAALSRRLIEFQDTLRPDLWDRVKIVTISTEPLEASPKALLRCGHRLGADFDRWTLATPTSADFTATAARLGTVIWQEEEEITAHTLSTLVVDQRGLLVDRFRGLTQWSVGDLIAAVVQTAER